VDDNSAISGPQIVAQMAGGFLVGPAWTPR